MELVGRAVRKTFEGFGTFTGVVDSYDPAARYFKILYEDGDSEEVEFAEITAILNAMDDSFSPPKNCSRGPDSPTPHFDPPPENDPRRLAEGFVSEYLTLAIYNMENQTNVYSTPDPIIRKKRQKLCESEKSTSGKPPRKSGRARRVNVSSPVTVAAEAPVPLGLKPALPSSSTGLDVDGLPIFDIFSVYTCLRSFSKLLFLSPFRLETFVAALRYRYADSLIDSIHYSILQALKLHLESLSQEGSRFATCCLGNLNWELLDLVTWPVYLAEYMLIRGSALRVGFKLGSLKLLSGEYYKQPATVKLEILRCLCDDLVEVEAIRTELNRRITESEPNADSNGNVSVAKKGEDSMNTELAKKGEDSMNTELAKKGEDSMNTDIGSSVAQEAPEEIGDQNIDECCLCRMDGNLICCDGCPAAFHSKCVGVVKDLLPEGDWYCPECSMQKDDGLGKLSGCFRGAEIVGVDPHGRIYFGSCSYLLVFDSSDTDATYHFYNKPDMDTVTKILSSNVSYNVIVNAISDYWGIPTEASCTISHLGYDIPRVHEQASPKPPSPSKHDVSEENCAFPKNCGLESSEVSDAVNPNLTSTQLSGKTCPVVNFGMSDEMTHATTCVNVPQESGTGTLDSSSLLRKAAAPKNCCPESSKVSDTVNPILTSTQLSGMTCPIVSFGISDEMANAATCVNIPQDSGTDCTTDPSSLLGEASPKNRAPESSEVSDTVNPNLTSTQVSGVTCPVVSSGTSGEMSHAATCVNVPQESGTDCTMDSNSLLREATPPNSYDLAVEQEKYIEFSGWRSLSFSTKQRRIGASQLQYDPAGYVNCYNFGRIASSIEEVLLRAVSKNLNKETVTSVEDIRSIQWKAISAESHTSDWYTYQNLSKNVKKEKCGWCFPCRTSMEADCLFKVADGKHLEGTEKQNVGLRSEKKKRSHLGCAMHHMLSIESRVRGLLSGPWQDVYYSQHWCKAVKKAHDIASLKQLLLLLESNLRRVALSSEWLKPMDSARMVGSASHIFTSSFHAKSNHSGSKRQAKKSLPTETSLKSRTATTSDIYWWRGGSLSRRVFNWMMLPRSLAYKSGRQAGYKKISSVSYPDSSEPNRSKLVAWRAAVEMSGTVSQLICQVKEFESNIRWSELLNSQLFPQMSKEAMKLTRAWKKVIVRKKCIEGIDVKYLLDFGKRGKIPAVISKHGVLLEECSDGRKKYWLNETYVPLNLVNTFEEKKLTRMFKRKDSMLSGKGSKCQESKPKRMKGLSHLLSREPKSQVCGQCSEDVLIREAVNCQYCNGYFHRKHFRVPKDVITHTYTCCGCKEKRSVKLNIRGPALSKSTEISRGKKLLKRSVKLNIRGPKLSESTEISKDNQLLKRSVRVNIRGLKFSESTKISKGTQLLEVQKKENVMFVRSKKKRRGVKKNNQSKAKRKMSESLEYAVRCPKRRRTVMHRSYWLNGLLWSNKPVDERGMHFLERKVVLPSQHIEDPLARPLCCLCGEKYNSEVIYIGCESCEDWFHGDVFSLTIQNINNLISLKCHKCRMKSRPTCPFSEKSVTDVQLRNEEVETMKIKNEELLLDGSYDKCATIAHSEYLMDEEQREDGVVGMDIKYYYRRRSAIGVKLPACADADVTVRQNGNQILFDPQNMGDDLVIPEFLATGTLGDYAESSPHAYTIHSEPQLVETEGEIP